MADTSILVLLLGITLCQGLGEIEKKVVEGDYVKIRHHPHAVYLEIKQENKQIHICGSSVLNQLFLVTVAHCFYGYKNSWVIVAFAGHENLKKAKLTRKGHYPIIHNKFVPSELTNDIALLLLNKHLPLGEHVKRIILKRFASKSITATLAGWGVINDITQEETMMLKSVTQTVRKKECYLVTAGPGTFCAGSMQSSDARPAHLMVTRFDMKSHGKTSFVCLWRPSSRTCATKPILIINENRQVFSMRPNLKGDSGSGLVDRNYQLIGLLSYKVNLYPALPVYTNASYYYGWIIREINKFCNYYTNSIT